MFILTSISDAIYFMAMPDFLKVLLHFSPLLWITKAVIFIRATFCPTSNFWPLWSECVRHFCTMRTGEYFQSTLGRHIEKKSIFISSYVKYLWINKHAFAKKKIKNLVPAHTLKSFLYCELSYRLSCWYQSLFEYFLIESSHPIQ